MATSTTLLPTISARRKRTDKFMRGLMLGLTLLALVPLVLVIYFLIEKGIGSRPACSQARLIRPRRSITSVTLGNGVLYSSA